MNYILGFIIEFTKRIKGFNMSKISNISNILETDNVTDTRIEIFGQNRIVIEGCYGIKEYSTEVIQIALPKGGLVILGTELELVCMSGRDITIRGHIISIEFEDGTI